MENESTQNKVEQEVKHSEQIMQEKILGSFDKVDKSDQVSVKKEELVRLVQEAQDMYGDTNVNSEILEEAAFPTWRERQNDKGLAIKIKKFLKAGLHFLLPSAPWVERTENFKGIDITGNTKFVSSIKEAIDIIEDIPEFEIVRGYVGAIKISDRSGMGADEKVPTFYIGRGSFAESLRSPSPAWLASCIVHDANHSLLYYQAKGLSKSEPDVLCWQGKEAEKKCLAVQIPALEKIAEKFKSNQDVFDDIQEDIKYSQELMQNPTYQGEDSELGQCYATRDW